jgi:peptidoglycan/xylan/chitin deacetylase (PgdA/CDA1 family)
MPLTFRDRVVRGGKRGVAAALHGSGLMALLQRAAVRRKAIVLTYHRVLSDEDRERSWSDRAIIVSHSTFDWHMASLRRWFTVVSLADFVARFESGRDFEPGTCLVTFDDGWSDTYANAWPILRRHGVPAAVFLPVDFIGSSRVFWQEELGAQLAGLCDDARREPARVPPLRAALSPFGLEGVLDVDRPQQRETAMRLVRARKQRADWPVDDVRRLVDELRGAPPSLPACDRFLTWEQAAEMAAGGISFGGHGASHRVLTALTADELEADIARCREVLAAKVAGAADAFCYPNGDHDAAVVETVRRHGFRMGFSTRRGLIAPGAPPFSLPRVNVHEDMTDNVPMFRARLTGLL